MSLGRKKNQTHDRSLFSSSANDWQHGIAQHSLLICTHQSHHYVQSGWWELSVISSWKGKKSNVEGKTCSGSPQLLQLEWRISTKQGSRKKENKLRPSAFFPFFICGLPSLCVIGCLTINTSMLVGEKDSTCCARNMPGCWGGQENPSVTGVMDVQEATVYFFRF